MVNSVSHVGSTRDTNIIQRSESPRADIAGSRVDPSCAFDMFYSVYHTLYMLQLLFHRTDLAMRYRYKMYANHEIRATRYRSEYDVIIAY